MQRRTYLIGSIAAVAGIAGCGSPGPGANETDGSPDEGIGTPTDPGMGSPDEPETDTPTEMGTEADDLTETEADDLTETESDGLTETEADDLTETEGGTPTETDGGMAVSVAMVTDDDSYFDPIGLAVEPGTTVEWINESGDHSSTAYEDRIPEAADPWDSGVLTDDGATYSHTFDEAGTYDYFCTPHQAEGMVARIVVGEPGGPAEEGMPPDGDVPESQRIVDEGSVGYDEFTGS